MQMRERAPLGQTPAHHLKIRSAVLGVLLNPVLDLGFPARSLSIRKDLVDLTHSAPYPTAGARDLALPRSRCWRLAIQVARSDLDQDVVGLLNAAHELNRSASGDGGAQPKQREHAGEALASAPIGA